MDKKYVTRFWSRVQRGNRAECWPWKGRPNKGGYGMFSAPWLGNRGAHVVAYELVNGPVPNSLCVLHKCDNRLCVNPCHLFLGTHPDNMRDMKEKRRQAFGERNATSKLSEQEVLEMRGLRLRGASTESLAKKYGVSLNTALRALRGESWAHLPGAVDARSSSPPRKPTDRRGERSPTAKLRAAEVAEIRRLRASYGVFYKDLAKMFGVDKMTACRICLGQAWRG